MRTTTETNERSVPELIRELRDEATELVRDEVALAKTEISEKVSRITRQTTLLIVGGAVAHLGLVFLLLALAAGIEVALTALDLPLQGDWLALLIVGAVVGIIGLVLVQKAKKTLGDTSVVPQRTVQTLKEDKLWLKSKVK